MDTSNPYATDIKPADINTVLAVERTELALERTHLGWIRTMLTIMTAGIAIDKGIEFIYDQRLIANNTIVENGHVLGITITSIGVICLFLETIQFVKRSKKLAALKNKTTLIFSTNLLLAILVSIIGIILIYLMLATG